VPRISYFYGITIQMYWNEGVHERPHFHARYGEHHASVELDGKILAGSLPVNAQRLVRVECPRFCGHLSAWVCRPGQEGCGVYATQSSPVPGGVPS
jgi:Domain of unknown function (DUF4160)